MGLTAVNSEKNLQMRCCRQRVLT
ncbi:uncharacterized protein G2W53_036818 [Senna tora]|uniref:Uncharacterized protein n=1 Tax=Senna tora TaxID=362788 RepID=A0A834SWJ5_9FABA|nr:uncharacterized protein G2W53_036818 [Senna tora]